MNWTQIIKTLQGAIAVTGGIVSAFVGGVDGLICTLLIFVVLDYLLGLTIAVMQKKLSSQVGYKGILKKVLIFIFVGMGHLLDVNVLGGTPVLRGVIIFFYLSNEGISIIENSAVLGLPVPEKLKDILIQLKEKKWVQPTEGDNDTDTKDNDTK